MRKLVWGLLGLGACVIVGAGYQFALKGEGFRQVAAPVKGCPAKLFDRKAEVFSAIRICATPKVPQEKLIHAANVAATWLDNDLDGVVDEPRVLEALQSRPAILVMSERGFSTLGYAKIFPAIEKMKGVGQDLSAAETNPANGRDASQEEIHHLLVAAGWAPAFPEKFMDQETSNSEMAQAWAKADAAGHYYYADPTCGPDCKVMEFHYLAAAAYLGSDADLESDEMRLKTREALAANTPEVIAMFEDSSYAYPKHRWPNGNYPHSTNITYMP